MPQEAKMSTSELLEKRAKFCIEFWDKYSSWNPTEIYNADETAINFDMLPTRFWALKGRKDPAKIVKLTKHTGRMTAVLTIRGDGNIGGDIERDELPTYPPGHYYTVQEHGWMDSTGWKCFVPNLLKCAFDGYAALLLDNFDYHVSEEGQRVVAEEANATVPPLPPNTTAVCQPLDVGVMGH
ncbi:unnamed protein product [Phytophthora fragariaefolia]|uniref:Unnamed protein product n=1 Tax=Phytophthora fragariaefolia TaxID=1490495 RepID=A0A9W7DFB3_9STRA|nr:unnamed protein product [Phytophthora fragariaefolia]